MESNIVEALKLLVVGMGTVFVVLLIIIEGGKLLIRAVNRFVPEDEKELAKAAGDTGVSPAVAKAIDAAVNQITGGQAKVIDIKKL